MTRRNRLALLAALALVIAVSGTVLATRAPWTPDRPAQLASSPEADNAPPTAEDLAHAAPRLTERGIAFTDAELADLAGRYGLGGAVRILAWAADPSTGLTAAQIAARRDGDGTAAVGWGKLAKELGLHPGIGWIMGNGGHDRDIAPRQQDDGG
jgi:hypothetical protein